MSDKVIEVITAWVGRAAGSTDDVDMAHRLLAAFKAARIAVVELPEPGSIEVTEIDCSPDGEPEWGGQADHRARMVIRFEDIPRPGRLFDRRELAAALLAAEAVTP